MKQIINSKLKIFKQRNRKQKSTTKSYGLSDSVYAFRKLINFI